MSDAKLSVEVGAKVDQAVAGIAKVVAVTQAGATQIDNSTAKIERSFQLLNNTKFTFGQNYVSASQKLANEAMRSSAVLGGAVVKGAKSANQAILELSRGIQDSPFGSMGYINNFQQFQALFGELVTKTGSVKAAFKALGGSLIGPAGLGVAFSAITAGIQFYTLWQQGSKKATEDATEANEKYIKSLGGLTVLTYEAVKSQAKEISTLDLVYRATQNANLGLDERKKAIAGLRALSPDHLKAYTDEQILAGKAGEAVKSLKNELLALGVVEAAKKQIGEQATAIFQNTEKRSVAAARLIELQKELNDVSTKGAKDTDTSEFSYANQGASVQILQGKIKDLSKEIKGYDDALTNANNKTDQAIAIQDQLIAKFGIEKVDSGVKKAVEEQAKVLKEAGEKAAEYRKRLAELREQQKLFGLSEGQRLASEIDKFNSNLVKSLKAADKADGIDKLIEKTKELHDLEIRGSGSPKQSIFFGDYLKEAQRVLDELNKFNSAASNIINNEISSTFAGIGTAIGDALSGSGNILANLSTALLSSLGGVLTNLGKLAIATGVGIKAIKTALKSLNPAIAIGAGIALVALGTAISKSVSKLGDLPGFANGVQNFRGGLAIVGERGPEVVNLPKGSNVIPNHRIGSMGGAANIFIPELRIAGEDIYVSFTKTAKRLNLLGG